MTKNEAGELGYKIKVGGGLGRTPIIGVVIREFLPREDLIAYLDAILRIYNLYGRRDNKYKARIKILVKSLTADVFAQKVEKEFSITQKTLKLEHDLIKKMDTAFKPFHYQALENEDLEPLFEQYPTFKHWFNVNTYPHKVTGYRIVTISLKRAGVASGDISADEMELIADLADQFTYGELRTTHEQNIAFTDVAQKDLFQIWQALDQVNLARAHIGFLTDIICCPGGDFCSLANAKSIPVYEAIMRRFDDLDTVYDLSKIDLNISGCMNACGHHHVGHIGILGIDKKGAEFYQITLGGNSGHDSSLGELLGPSLPASDIPDVIEEILNTYLDLRLKGEIFLDTYRRVSIQPFKQRAYA